MGTCQAGDRSYGLESTMGWTAAWAASTAKAGRLVCPSYRTSKGVRFAAAVLWVGNVGESQGIWVDYQNH
jgi:hypothetical protein